jgi:hypothetical protein
VVFGWTFLCLVVWWVLLNPLSYQGKEGGAKSAYRFSTKKSKAEEAFNFHKEVSQTDETKPKRFPKTLGGDNGISPSAHRRSAGGQGEDLSLAQAHR